MIGFLLLDNFCFSSYYFFIYNFNKILEISKYSNQKNSTEPRLVYNDDEVDYLAR
jgi:hypothetical protein